MKRKGIFRKTLAVALDVYKRQEGKNPFQLDSKEPNWEDFQGFLKGEVRYASVMLSLIHILNTKNVVLLHLFPNGILKTVSNVTSVHTFVLTLLSVRSFSMQKNRRAVSYTHLDVYKRQVP